MTEKKMTMIRVYMKNTWSTQIPLLSDTVPKCVCKKINGKHMSSSSGSVELGLYLSTYKSDKKELEGQVLRRLRDDENVLELEKELLAKKLPHEYHALPEELYKVKEEKLEADSNENFSKRKWEKAGDLQKLSLKEQKFLKRTFYLGKEAFYCTNKASKT